MHSYSAPRVPPKLDKAARDPPDPPQPFPVPFRPPASACGARFFSFFTANTGKKAPLFCTFRSLIPTPHLSFHFLRTCPQLPHMSSHMSGHHPATVRRAGRKRGARFESSEALAELPAVARTAVELHGCCARVSLAAALLSQHIDGVARAGSAGTKSGSSARSLVLLTMLAPVVENRTVEGSATARRRSELANRRPK